MDVSVIIPVFNEQENISELIARLTTVLGASQKNYEVILVDDGSKDRSFSMLKDLAKSDPHLKVIRFNRNYGQHNAIFAGFAEAKGSVIVTLDADLQNPPEEIPKLLAKMAEGYEVVGGYRQNRQDSIFRKIPTYLVAKMTSRFVGVHLKDYGSMLRAYKKDLVDAMLESGEVSTYIPALANSLASSVAEIPVDHQARSRGESKYSLLKLLHLNFDLMTSFSLMPIQLIGLAGVVIAFSGLAFSVFLLVMRFIMGSEWAVGGVFTLFGILFFFVGLQVLAIGIMGEYIGRIYQEVRKRPRYRVQEIFTSQNSR